MPINTQQVHLYYPSKRVIKPIANEIDAKIIRQLCYGEYGYAANAIWSKKELRSEILDKFLAEVSQECQDICSVKEPSMLRKCDPKSLSSFSAEDFATELKQRAPTFHSCLEASMTIKKDLNKNKLSVPPLTMAASVLLRQRCPQMSAMAYRYSIGVLWHSGAKKQVKNNPKLVFLFVRHSLKAKYMAIIPRLFM